MTTDPYTPQSLKRLRALAGDPVQAEAPGEFSNATTQSLVTTMGWRTTPTHKNPTSVDVRDEEGTLQFALPVHATPVVMNEILEYGRRQYIEGKRQGELEAQQRIRVVLGFKD